MNKQETYQVLAMLQANYPDAFRGMSEKTAQVKVNLWAEMFTDEPAEVVAAAAKAYIAADVKGFMPTIGQIKDRIEQMRTPEQMTGQEAWNLVSKALRNSAYGSAEEFAKLPRDIQRTVGSAEQLREWALMETETVQSVVASNFQRSYRVRLDRDRDNAKLPSDVKTLIDRVAGRMELPGEIDGRDT